MAEIIQLAGRRGRVSLRPAATETAKILFFTGVRYERLDGTVATERVAVKKTGRKRIAKQ